MFRKCLSLLLLTAPLAADGPQGQQGHMQVQHRIVDGTTLKSWYSDNKPMVVLDARSKAYFDGNLLPNAKQLSSEANEQEISSTIPNRDALVVVYCAGAKCPASGWLVDKLQTMGYNNVYEYHDGIQDWMQRGYPTSQQ